MILSGHQPVYLPSLHLFSKIALSDQFMFVGHCQFVAKSWHTRNVIRNGENTLTLSVPVLKKGKFGQSINETEINGDHWKRKHLASIRGAYQKQPFFKDYFPTIEKILNQPWTSLGEMNIALIRQFLEWLEIDTPLLFSERHDITGQKNDMLISMCRAVNADQYLSNEGSRVYVDEDYLLAAGIKHHWQGFKHPTYEQGADFIENLSVIDGLFNVGPELGELIRQSGHIL